MGHHRKNSVVGIGTALVVAVTLLVAGCTRSIPVAEPTTAAPSTAAPDSSTSLGGSTAAPTTATPVPPRPVVRGIAENLASVPLPAIAAATKRGGTSNPVRPVDEEPLTSDGKPEVLYVGAEFCPYCAGERWAMVVALSKFGTFSGLTTIHSSEGDVPTLSFLDATYSSEFVSFNPIELQGQDREPLEEATEAERALFERLGRGGFPFIDFGGTAVQSGGSVDVTNLIDRDPEEIAATLAASTDSDTDPTSLEGNVNAVAGGFITTICGLTGDQPAEVCAAFDTTI
ncbi:MAG TPA: DUF929 family protein [Acidimicrobiales bacterium]|nr:DUF929 family protein [Acidimicrobiales bacterium]